MFGPKFWGFVQTGNAIMQPRCIDFLFEFLSPEVLAQTKFNSLRGFLNTLGGTKSQGSDSVVKLNLPQLCAQMHVRVTN